MSPICGIRLVLQLAIDRLCPRIDLVICVLTELHQFMAVRIKSAQWIVSNIGVEIEALWIAQSRIRYWTRPPIGR